MKIRIILSLLTTLLISHVNGTGLSFQTLNPTVGDILKADNSTTLDDGALFRFGTVTDDDFTGFTSITQYEAVFTQLGSNTFSGGEVTGVLSTGSVAGNVDLYGIVYSGSSLADPESAFFFIGTTPALSSLSGAPISSTVLYGSKVGNNINLAPAVIPEPSTFAAIAGLLALGWVMARRRR